MLELVVEKPARRAGNWDQDQVACLYRDFGLELASLASFGASPACALHEVPQHRRDIPLSSLASLVTDRSSLQCPRFRQLRGQLRGQALHRAAAQILSRSLLQSDENSRFPNSTTLAACGGMKRAC